MKILSGSALALAALMVSPAVWSQSSWVPGGHFDDLSSVFGWGIVHGKELIWESEDFQGSSESGSLKVQIHGGPLYTEIVLSPGFPLKADRQHEVSFWWHFTDLGPDASSFPPSFFVACWASVSSWEGEESFELELEGAGPVAARTSPSGLVWYQSRRIFHAPPRRNRGSLSIRCENQVNHRASILIDEVFLRPVETKIFRSGFEAGYPSSWTLVRSPARPSASSLVEGSRAE